MNEQRQQQQMNDDELDVLLRGHFANELDAQLGRAPAAFSRSSIRRLRSPWRAAVWSGAGLAMAAAVAAVLTYGPLLKLIRNGEGHDNQIANKVSPTPATVVSDEPDVQHEIAWNTIDQGTVIYNDEPMRSIRRERVDRMSWFDASSNATVEVTVPHNEVILVGLQAN